MASFPEHNSKQASQAEPTIEEIKEWDVDELLKWIQQKRPKLLKDDDLKELKAARISGRAFLIQAGNVEFFEKKCNLPIGPSLELADLSSEIAERDNQPNQTAGQKRKGNNIFDLAYDD